MVRQKSTPKKHPPPPASEMAELPAPPPPLKSLLRVRLPPTAQNGIIPTLYLPSDDTTSNNSSLETQEAKRVRLEDESTKSEASVTTPSQADSKGVGRSVTFAPEVVFRSAATSDPSSEAQSVSTDETFLPKDVTPDPPATAPPASGNDSRPPWWMRKGKNYRGFCPFSCHSSKRQLPTLLDPIIPRIPYTSITPHEFFDRFVASRRPCILRYDIELPTPEPADSVTSTNPSAPPSSPDESENDSSPEEEGGSGGGLSAGVPGPGEEFNALVSGWASNEYLLRRLCEDGAEGIEVDVEIRRPGRKESFGEGRKKKMTFAKFLGALESGEEHLYLTTQKVPVNREGPLAVGGDILEKSPLSNDFPDIPSIMGNLVLYQHNVWMGNSKVGTSTGLHHDYHDNLYVVIRGCKTFRLYPPCLAEGLDTIGVIRKIHSNGLISYDQLHRADGASVLAVVKWREEQALNQVRVLRERLSAIESQLSRLRALVKRVQAVANRNNKKAKDGATSNPNVKLKDLGGVRWTAVAQLFFKAKEISVFAVTSELNSKEESARLVQEYIAQALARLAKLREAKEEAQLLKVIETTAPTLHRTRSTGNDAAPPKQKAKTNAASPDPSTDEKSEEDDDITTTEGGLVACSDDDSTALISDDTAAVAGKEGGSAVDESASLAWLENSLSEEARAELALQRRQFEEKLKATESPSSPALAGFAPDLNDASSTDENLGDGLMTVDEDGSDTGGEWDAVEDSETPTGQKCPHFCQNNTRPPLPDDNDGQSKSSIPPLPPSLPDDSDLHAVTEKLLSSYFAEVSLLPGDVLYLPASWFHEVISKSAPDSTTGNNAGHLAFNYWMYPPTSKDFKNPYSDEYWPRRFRKLQQRLEIDRLMATVNGSLFAARGGAGAAANVDLADWVSLLQAGVPAQFIALMAKRAGGISAPETTTAATIISSNSAAVTDSLLFGSPTDSDELEDQMILDDEGDQVTKQSGKAHKSRSHKRGSKRGSKRKKEDPATNPTPPAPAAPSSSPETENEPPSKMEDTPASGEGTAEDSSPENNDPTTTDKSGAQSVNNPTNASIRVAFSKHQQLRSRTNPINKTVLKV